MPNLFKCQSIWIGLLILLSHPLSAESEKCAKQVVDEGESIESRVLSRLEAAEREHGVKLYEPDPESEEVETSQIVFGEVESLNPFFRAAPQRTPDAFRAFSDWAFGRHPSTFQEHQEHFERRTLEFHKKLEERGLPVGSTVRDLAYQWAYRVRLDFKITPTHLEQLEALAGAIVRTNEHVRLSGDNIVLTPDGDVYLVDRPHAQVKFYEGSFSFAAEQYDLALGVGASRPRLRRSQSVLGVDSGKAGFYFPAITHHARPAGDFHSVRGLLLELQAYTNLYGRAHLEPRRQ